MTDNERSSEELPEVTIYADGACSGNPGPGGYASILIYGGKVKEITGCEPYTTNNRMEMRAVLEALESLRRRCKVVVFTDSQYLKKGFTEWLPRWERNGWHTSQKKEVKNRDLWERLLRLCGKHLVEWRWLKGHGGDPLNERCDRLAKGAIKDCTG